MSKDAITRMMSAAMSAILALNVLTADPAPLRAQFTTPTPPNITGTWSYAGNVSGQVKITASGSTVQATFVSPIKCDAAGTLTSLFTGTLDTSTAHDLGAYKLTGSEFYLCSKNNQVDQDCNLLDPSTSPFTAQLSLDGNTISGSYSSQWYKIKLENGHYTCARDPSGDQPSNFSLTRVGSTNCDQLQRGYDQDKALLDTLDAQQQAAADVYTKLATSWNATGQQISKLQPQAQTEWATAGLANTAQAFLTVTADVLFDTLAPEAESVVPEAQPGAWADAADAVKEYNSAYQAASQAQNGNFEQLREWAVEQSALYDMSALIKMIDLAEQQSETGTQITADQTAYETNDVNRAPLAARVANDLIALNSCLGR